MASDPSLRKNYIFLSISVLFLGQKHKLVELNVFSLLFFSCFKHYFILMHLSENNSDDLKSFCFSSKCIYVFKDV